MIKKIRQWLRDRKKPVNHVVDNLYTRKQLENVYKLGYNDGKRDGLTIARNQATKSLKEILWQQNKNQ